MHTGETDSACTSSVRHGGGYTLAGGDWKFVPAVGAVVATIDTEFQYFGWWQRETGDGHDGGHFPCRLRERGGRVVELSGLAALQGEATYRGPAVGRVAIRPQIGDGTAGDFTATATLVVDFGDVTAGGTVEGTIDGFRVDGVSMPSWSVELGTAGIDAAGAIAAGTAGTAVTAAWSIGGNVLAAPTPAQPLTWSGQFHDVGDDRVPATATGTFEASHGGLGRMTGAFGTTRQP